MPVATPALSMWSSTCAVDHLGDALEIAGREEMVVHIDPPRRRLGRGRGERQRQRAEPGQQRPARRPGAAASLVTAHSEPPRLQFRRKAREGTREGREEIAAPRPRRLRRAVFVMPAAYSESRSSGTIQKARWPRATRSQLSKALRQRFQ